MNKHCHTCRHAESYEEDDGLVSYSCHVDYKRPRFVDRLDGCEEWEEVEDG